MMAYTQSGRKLNNRTPSQAAFSLVELLVVVSIVTLLAVFSIPAYTSIGKSVGLNDSAGKIVDQLNLARQTAISKNRNIEVRFYKAPDPLDNTKKVYRAIRIRQNNNTSTNDLVRIQYLANGVQISDGANFSSLIASVSSGGNSPVRASDLLSASSGTCDYVQFQYRPDGSTDLPTTSGASAWYLTILLEQDIKNGPVSGLPPNFVTIQIDPNTGRPKLYRP